MLFRPVGIEKCIELGEASELLVKQASQDIASAVGLGHGGVIGVVLAMCEATAPQRFRCCIRRC